MARITGQKIRQMLWVPGQAPVDGLVLDRLELYNEDGSPADLAPAQGFRWMNEWVTETDYLMYDVVRDPVDGNLYLSASDHTSGASPPSEDGANWGLFLTKGPQGDQGNQGDPGEGGSGGGGAYIHVKFGGWMGNDYLNGFVNTLLPEDTVTDLTYHYSSYSELLTVDDVGANLVAIHPFFAGGPFLQGETLLGWVHGDPTSLEKVTLTIKTEQDEGENTLKLQFDQANPDGFDLISTIAGVSTSFDAPVVDPSTLTVGQTYYMVSRFIDDVLVCEFWDEHPDLGGTYVARSQEVFTAAEKTKWAGDYGYLQGFGLERAGVEVDPLEHPAISEIKSTRAFPIVEDDGGMS